MMIDRWVRTNIYFVVTMLTMLSANQLKSRTPLGAQAHQLYGLLCDKGYNTLLGVGVMIAPIE